MRTDIFRAESIQQAVVKVKEALGADAMILSTRKLPSSPRDPYSKQMFEVKAISAEYGVIREELVNIKDLISLAGFGTGMQSMTCSYPESRALFASLVRNGVSEQIVTSLLQSAFFTMENQGIMENERAGFLKKYVLQECIKQMDTSDPFAVIETLGRPHVAAFVGPTGVGKTTTIAKLAAELSLKRKKKVGLISIDNYRIGAFEQLKSYASIMGLLSVPAFTKDDLSNALDKMKDMDIVLIDTAGHSHSDSVRMNEAEQLISGDFKISVHLVLSVTTDSIDMKEAARAFSSLKPDSYVFTKIDEAKRCGKILDQISTQKLPVSMITNGQRVPEDLIIPDVNRLLGIVLGA
ncbi:MAG: protein FlhF [Thermodesulfobacteriota bacterium]|nr:protein FlhF [Thermodesulfobacteriota bacterium]